MVLGAPSKLHTSAITPHAAPHPVYRIYKSVLGPGKASRLQELYALDSRLVPCFCFLGFEVCSGSLD